MSKSLLPLCSIPKQAMRDGWAGAYAHILLPFSSSGFWFASGQIPTFPESTIAQDRSRTLSGTTKPDTFQKDCCSCIAGQ